MAYWDKQTNAIAKGITASELEPMNLLNKEKTTLEKMQVLFTAVDTLGDKKAKKLWDKKIPLTIKNQWGSTQVPMGTWDAKRHQAMKNAVKSLDDKQKKQLAKELLNFKL